MRQAARPIKRKPITAARVEECLDKLADLMSRSKRAHMLVLIWKRLESELARLHDEEAVIAMAKSRAASRSAATTGKSAN